MIKTNNPHMIKLYTAIRSNIKWIHIILLYILQICIFQFMYRYTFPIISSGSSDTMLFDMMKSGYDIRVVRATVETFTQAGKHTYMFVQMPVDFIYPIVMASVMMFILVTTSKKYNAIYFLLPIVFILLDWVENACILHFLTATSISNAIVKVSSLCTQSKAILGDYILYYMAIIFIVIYVVRWIITGYRNKAVKNKA